MLKKLITLVICFLTVYIAQGMSSTASDSPQKKPHVSRVPAAVENMGLLVEKYKNCLTQALRTSSPAEKSSCLDQARSAILQVEEIVCSTKLNGTAQTETFLDQAIKALLQIEEMFISTGVQIGEKNDWLFALLYFKRYESSTDPAEKNTYLEQANIRGMHAVESMERDEKKNDEERAKAYFLLSIIFREKSVLAQNPQQKELFNQRYLELNLKAAEKGHAVAQLKEADICWGKKRLSAHPTEKLEYESKAIKWLEKAASQGNAKAQNALGVAFYAKAHTVTAEERADLVANAVYYLFEASQQGHTDAKSNLKDVLLNSNIAQSIKKHAETGNRNAQFLTGAICLVKMEHAAPKEKEAHRQKALEWLEKSADQNYPSAQNTLGEILYEKAKTVNNLLQKKRLVRASVQWFFLAERGGHPRAHKNLETAVREYNLKLIVNGNVLDVIHKNINSHTETTCAKCFQPADKMCGGCKKIHYCSRKCQIEDRSKHKPHCHSTNEE